MSESLRVRNLVGMEALGTSLLAGADGLDRVVLWAHSCEMPSPERWLGPNELLMTIGLCIPPGEADQVEFIRRLHQAQLAGVTVGDDQMAPEITPGMLAEADRLGFPVMLTAHTVPFAVIGRTVAAANSTTQTQQVLTLSRLYHALIKDTGAPEEFLQNLERVFNVRMAVLDTATNAVLLPGSLTLDPETVQALAGLAGTAPGAGTVRLGAVGEDRFSVWSVPSRRRTLLVVDESHGSMLDAFTVVHLGQAVSVEADRRAARALADGAKGAGVVAAVYAGDANLTRLEAEAAELGLDTADLTVLVTVDGDNGLLGEALSLAGIVHGSVLRRGYLVTCLATRDVDAACAALLLHGKRVGVSDPFEGLGGLREAALNAQWALGTVRDTAQGVIRYNDAEFSVLPRSEGEAHEVIHRVLGPLMDRDGEASVLVETLCSYLDHDRNWTAAAAQLGIHRQTLGYRLQRIEKLTGRSLKNTRDLAELWIARTALKRA
ncbi:PucR family transcriptional regulator [Arthrobacter sp. GCM10027362]|uniref:PucR family transcriptional regulator n=1 Tax=Arthrobacter sp. GCM10027362 TaxID=3273379 RepID=UPI003632DAAF